MRSLKLFAALLFSFGIFAVAAPAPTVSAFELFGDGCEQIAGTNTEVCGPCKDNPDATACKDSKDGKNPIYGPDGIIATVVNILTLIIGIAAVIVIIIAGIQYMLSTGDPTKVNNSKNAILYAVAGLVIAAMAQIIVRFIISRLS